MKKNVRKCDSFFTKMEGLGLALSFNDVRLETAYSEISPAGARLTTHFSRNIGMEIPIISAAMDTVTEASMAITMAKLGGLGIIHRSLSPKEQASAVSKVKFDLNGFIPNPICVSADDTVKEVLDLRKQKGYKFLSFMVTDEGGKIVGLVTHNDFDFCSDPQRKISEIMSADIMKADSSINVGDAYRIMMDKDKKILPIFDGEEFKGIYTLSDVKRILSGNSRDYNLDANGSLRVGAAIGVGEDSYERLKLLSKSRVDAVVIDTAHGNSKAVVEMIKYCKANYPHIDVVAGNISEGEAAKRLVDAGADAIKIGQGPGSICTTRIVAGIGRPQLTAIYNCEKAIRGSGVPIIADGGIEYSGDIVMALAAGADTVMLGRLLAGTKESPGEIIYKDGHQVKVYRGMGSLEAMLANQSSRERYGQENTTPNKLVAEGVKSFIDFKGDVVPIIYQLTGGSKAGMGYIGAETIGDLHERAEFFRITTAGLSESHPHGLNYIETSSQH